MIGIVGSNGFIGRTVVDRFLFHGMQVRAFVRSSPAALPIDVETGFLDLSETLDPSSFSGLDTLVLLASASRPNSPGNTPSRELRDNVTPYLNLFDCLKRTNVKHLIYLSSGGAVYGDRSSAKPISESEPCIPADAYGYGKLCIERALSIEWKQEGRYYTVIRPSNPIGKHQLGSIGTHGLVSTALYNIRNGLPITVYGDGRIVRDYFSATDLADLIYLAAFGPKRNTVVNASSAEGLSILEVIEKCTNFLGIKADVKINEATQQAVANNVLCNKLAKDILDWQPRISFNKILCELNEEMDRKSAHSAIQP